LPVTAVPQEAPRAACTPAEHPCRSRRRTCPTHRGTTGREPAQGAGQSREPRVCSGTRGRL